MTWTRFSAPTRSGHRGCRGADRDLLDVAIAAAAAVRERRRAHRLRQLAKHPGLREHRTGASCKDCLPLPGGSSPDAKKDGGRPETASCMSAPFVTRTSWEDLE